MGSMDRLRDLDSRAAALASVRMVTIAFSAFVLVVATALGLFVAPPFALVALLPGAAFLLLAFVLRRQQSLG